MRVASSTPGPTSPLQRGMPHSMLVCLCVGLVLGVLVPAPWWAMALIPLCGVVAMGRPGSAVLVGLAGLLCACGWVWATGRAAQTAPAAVTAAGDLRALAVVDASPRRRPTGGWRVTVRVGEVRSSADPRVRGARLLVWLRGTPPRVGEVVLLRGALRPAARDDAPGWWLRYLERQRISGAVATGRLPVLGRRGGPAGPATGRPRRSGPGSASTSRVPVARWCRAWPWAAATAWTPRPRRRCATRASPICSRSRVRTWRLWAW